MVMVCRAILKSSLNKLQVDDMDRYIDYQQIYFNSSLYNNPQPTDQLQMVDEIFVDELSMTGRRGLLCGKKSVRLTFRRSPYTNIE